MNDENPQSAVLRLASSLSYALNISHSQDDLVVRIGDSLSTNNLEAVQAWVARQTQHPDFDMARRMLPLLIDRLEWEISHAR
jgi:hypothetical protein